MTDKAREEAAEAIIADARARAERIPYAGVRVNLLRAAEQKAARVRAGLPSTPPSCWPVAAGNGRGGSTLVSRDLRDVDGRPRATERRRCLRCRKSFDSHGPHNRLCDPCRSRDVSPYAV